MTTRGWNNLTKPELTPEYDKFASFRLRLFNNYVNENLASQTEEQPQPVEQITSLELNQEAQDIHNAINNIRRLIFHSNPTYEQIVSYLTSINDRIVDLFDKVGKFARTSTDTLDRQSVIKMITNFIRSAKGLSNIRALQPVFNTLRQQELLNLSLMMFSIISVNLFLCCVAKSCTYCSTMEINVEYTPIPSNLDIASPL